MMARLFRFKVGSAAWLLRHECRLFFYDMGDDKGGKQPQRGMPYPGMALIAFVLAAIHFGVWQVMHGLPPLHAEPPATILMGGGLALAVVFSLMLSLALNRSVKALFERGDLDLLLSSPMSAHTIFGVRLAGIVFGVALLFLLFLTPFAHIGLLLGQPRWLGVYPALIALASLASALAMLLTLVLVRWLGLRRTRTAAQLLGALSGAALFLASQLFGNFGHEWRVLAFAYLQPWFQEGAPFGPTSLVWLPARAVFGSLPAGLVLLAASLAACWLVARFTHDFFVRGVQQAGGVSGAPIVAGRPAALQFRFRGGVWRTILFKEWRLIARDTQLISQLALQLLYMLPLFFVVIKGRAMLPGMAAGMSFLAASLAGSLIWIIVAAEDAPDLLRAAPLRPARITQIKLLAGVLPAAALIAPVLIWLSLHQTWLAFCMSLTCLAAMSSAALIQLWQGKPGVRSQFNKRGQSQLKAGLIEALSSFSWAGTLYLGQQGQVWGWATLATALATLGLAWLLRIESS
ncbi:MAG: hypothetical protein HYZ65_00560 [Burkholderiales bacterium]|nr:hypothetical protein [Burkholderiales bacterium]